MKSNLTHVMKRKFFQLEIDDGFRKKLEELAFMDGLSASGVVRMLVNREHANRLNGYGKPPLAPDQVSNDPKESQ